MTVIYNQDFWENEVCCENGIWYIISRCKTSKETSKEAAKAKKDIVTARLPDGVYHIGQGAFRGCSRLTSVYISGSVRRIEDNAFRDCTGLKSLIIQNGVVEIGDYAFCGCYNLETVVLPDTIAGIGACAFKNCRKLASVALPNNWQYTLSIDKNAFQGCRRLSRDVQSQLKEQIRRCLRNIDMILWMDR